MSYLHHQLLPFAMRTYGHDYYILHDNARVHSAAIVNRYLATNLTGTLLSHHPYSPDLNPVEQLGNLIKKRFYEFLNVPHSDQAMLRDFNA